MNGAERRLFALGPETHQCRASRSPLAQRQVLMASKSHIIMSVNNSIFSPKKSVRSLNDPIFFVIRLKESFFCTVCSPSRSLHSEPLRRTKRKPKSPLLFKWREADACCLFHPLLIFIFYFAMCTNSTHALCIGCTQRLPRCIMLTPQAGGAIYQDGGKKKVIWSTTETSGQAI